MNLSTITTCIAIILSLQASARVLCVDPKATGSANGDNWENAVTDLQSAFVMAQPGDQVWVSASRYTLSTEGIVWPREVAVYGGFSGDETTKHERKPMSVTAIVRLATSTASHFITDSDSEGRFIMDGFRLVDESQSQIDRVFALNGNGDVIIENVEVVGTVVRDALLCKTGEEGDVKMKGCKWTDVLTARVLFCSVGDLHIEQCAFDERIYDNPLFDVSGEVILRNIEIDGVLWSEVAGPY